MPTVSVDGASATSQELVPAPATGFIRVWGVSATGTGPEVCTLTLCSGSSTVKWQLYSAIDIGSNISVAGDREPIFDCAAGQNLSLVTTGDGQYSVAVQYALQ